MDISKNHLQNTTTPRNMNGCDTASNITVKGFLEVVLSCKFIFNIAIYHITSISSKQFRVNNYRCALKCRSKSFRLFRSISLLVRPRLLDFRRSFAIKQEALRLSSGFLLLNSIILYNHPKPLELFCVFYNNVN